MTYLPPTVDWLELRARFIATDQQQLLHSVKALLRHAEQHPDMVDYECLKTAKHILDEAISHDPSRALAHRQSAA